MPQRRTPNKLEHYSKETVLSREASRLFHLGPPWAAWLGAPVAGLVVHNFWPTPLAALFGLVCASLLAFGSYQLTHERKGRHGRLMAPVSFGLLGAWLAWVDLAGVTRLSMAVWFIGGLSGAWYWSHWLHAREHEDAGAFAKKFKDAAAVVGHEDVKVLSLEPLGEDEGDGQQGMIRPPPGVTAEDFGKELRRIEGVMGAPVGSLNVTTHLPDASLARLSVSNPLILEGVQPWPGPSIPEGGSIADPIRVGRYATGQAEKLVVVNDLLQVMGKTGSGKSFGWAWNEDAEQFTRYDAAVMGADITKAEQTLGPMAEGLHRIETTRDGVAALLEGVHRVVPLRTAALTAKGFNRWFKGCGLTHLTVNLEEAPDICDLLEDGDLIRMWLSDLKAGRSAGIRWRLSLQRSTFDQMPVIVRSQLSRCCFGLADADDAEYGLSEVQWRAKCHPGDWSHKFPGKHYLDVPGIPEDLVSVEARSYGWGDASKDGGVEGARMMRAHCAKYPAVNRPLDEVTAMGMEPPVIASSVPPPQAVPDRPKEATMMPDPDNPYDDLEGDLPEAGTSPTGDPDTGQPDWVFGEDDDAPDRVPDSPEVARHKVRVMLDSMRERGVITFGLEEWAELLEDTGRGISWLYGEMRKLAAEGQIQELPTRPRTWRLGRRAA